MATPITSHLEIPGTLGEILLDVRTGDPGSRRAAVIVLPGFKGFKDFGPFPSLGERLARAGFASVTLSTSGSGVDRDGEFTRLDRFARNTITAELADLSRTLDALQSGALGVAPPTSIGLVGHSRGGGVALLFAARQPAIAALVTWAAVATLSRWTPEEATAWRRAGVTQVLNSRTGQALPLYPDLLDDVERHAEAFDLEVAARQLATPWLLAHGTEDETVSVVEGRRLAGLAGPGLQPLWLEGGSHGFGGVHPFAGMTPHLARLFDATVSHFSRHLS